MAQESPKNSAAAGCLQVYVSLLSSSVEVGRVPAATAGEIDYRRGYCDALDFGALIARQGAKLLAETEDDFDRLLDVAMEIHVHNLVSDERRCF